MSSASCLKVEILNDSYSRLLGPHFTFSLNNFSILTDLPEHWRKTRNPAAPRYLKCFNDFFLYHIDVFSDDFQQGQR